MAIRTEALGVASRVGRSAVARIELPRVRLHPSALNRLALGAVCLVGGAELVQTAAAFVGSEQLLWYHQDFPAFYTAAHLVTHGGGT